jgi:hypothetical protein
VVPQHDPRSAGPGHCCGAISLLHLASIREITRNPARVLDIIPL